MEVFQNASKNKVFVLCWSCYCFLLGSSDAHYKLYCCPAVHLSLPQAPECLSGLSADRSLIQISLWLEGETHYILLWCHKLTEELFFLNQACHGWIIGRPAALDWLALQSDQRAPLPKLRSADTSVPFRPAPGHLPAPAEKQSGRQNHKQSLIQLKDLTFHQNN